MRILIGSYTFAPAVGGVESVSQVLARAWRQAGHEVGVVTLTPAGPAAETPQDGYSVVRGPGARELLSLVSRADVYWQNNISLRMGWPCLVSRTPLVITHQTWLGHFPDARSPNVRVKRLFLRRARSVAISRAIADHLHGPAEVIGNPYDDALFGTGSPAGPVAACPAAPSACPSTSARDFLFVGRLVADKGADLFIRALALLRSRGLAFSATLVGDGPERDRLEQGAREAALGGSGSTLEFRGALRGEALALCYRSHRVLAVPSRWQEPLGIVALEGIASGCVVVGSTGGGLPEAIGPCGLTFASGSPEALADTLLRARTDEALGGRVRAAAEGHLARFRTRSVADAYLALFQEAIRS